MRLLAPILANLLVFVSAFGLGGLLRPLLPKRLSWVDQLAAISLGGFGLLGVTLFLMGLVTFSRGAVLAFLFLAALLGLWQFRDEVIRRRAYFRFSSTPILPAAIVAVVLIVTFVGGLAEPVGDIKLDAIAYHYLGPQVWLRDARIHPLPDECHASFPATVETAYAALMAVGGTRAPNLFAVFSVASLLLVAFGFAIRLGLDPPGAWWAIVLVATMPVVYRGAYGGFVDAIFAGFVLLALRFALDADESSDYLFAGIFGGMAMGTKYTGLPTFVLILIVAVAMAWVRSLKAPLKLLPRFALLAAAGAAIASPWYLRNWLVLGSPIYPPPPGLLRFFHIKYMSPQTIDTLAQLVRKEGLGMGHGPLSLLLLPFNLTFHPANFLNGPGGVGIALLALAPLGFLLRWRDPVVGAIGFFSFMEVLGWFVTEQEARFLIPIYVLLAIFAIWGWLEVVAKSPHIGRALAAATVACSILYGLMFILPDQVANIHAVVSPNFEQRRKRQEIPYLDSMLYLNGDDTVGKVLVLEPRLPTFYLKKNYLKPVGRFNEQSIPEGNNFQLLAGKLSFYGITHVLDVRLDDNNFRVPQDQPNLELIFEREDQRIYRVVAPQ